MLSKAKIKLIHSLEQKKNRQAEGLFVAEGPKVVGDLLPYFRPRFVIATRRWIESNVCPSDAEIIEVTDDELAKASFLKTPQEVLAVFEATDRRTEKTSDLRLQTSDKTSDLRLQTSDNSLTLVLDDVQDPGNLGTIIRTADWFGVRQIVCSHGTADAFSPKVVQATMGAIARVHVRYADLSTFLSAVPAGTPIYGTFLEGENIYRHPLSAGGLIVMGNEGNGISPAVGRYITDKLFIPPYPTGCATSESLNVAIATAVTLAEFRSRTYK
jgi:TrmH family RNA methyltransferase